MNVAHIDISANDLGAIVVAVSGEIDLAIHEALSDSLQSAVKKAAADGAGEVVVDLSRTSFLDSSGIRVLVEGHQAAAVAGVAYAVTGATGLVHTVLKVTGVLDVLTQGSNTPAAEPTA